MKMDRRSLLLSLPAVAAVPRAMFASAATPKNRLIVGTGTGGGSKSKGLYLTEWKPETGEIGDFSLIAELESPTYFCIDRPQSHLFAISENASQVTAYHVNHGKPLTLDKLNMLSSDGAGPAHVSTEGRSVFVSNYGGGSLTSFKVETDGKLSGPVSHFQISPVDGAPEHQQPHIHESTPTPDGKWLLVNDLGSDRIWIYNVDKETAKLTPGKKQAFWQGRDKSGPRHMRIHPNGHWVYSVNELDATVDHLEWNAAEGTLTTLGSFVSTITLDMPKNKTFPSEILLSADGRFAYVGNRRGSDTIARLDLDPKTGAPKLAQLMPFGGVTARDITLDPSGRYLLVACQDSGAVVVLGINKKTGEISKPLHSYPIDSAQCLVFTT